MSSQVTTALIQQYSKDLMFALQQKGSRLENAVRKASINAEYEYFDEVGAATAAEITTRHADTVLSNTPHSRRRVGSSWYAYADMVDTFDQVRVNHDFRKSYAQAAAWALGRQKDELIIDAAFGTAYTGKTGSTSVTFPSANEITLSSGITIAGLREAKYMLDSKDNDPDEERYIALTAYQMKELLETTEITSSDYNTVKALVHGEVDSFLGFKFIQTELLDTASSVRSCIAWVKSGILLATARDVRVKISERADKNYGWQVYADVMIGATRMNENKVLKLKCTES